MILRDLHATTRLGGGAPPRKARILSIGAGLACLAAAIPAALAQQAPPAGGSQTGSALQEVVVTGSRLRQSIDATASPIVTLGSAQLAQTGELTVTDALEQMPQFGAAFDNEDQSYSAVNSSRGVGTSLLNLRNLGTQRTLTLVDGDRFVGGNPGTSSVDLNVIPSLLIDHVDVVTGAATAVYGADAVSGVVNVVLKDKFQGLEAYAHGGTSEHGDGTEYSFGALMGGNFAADKGNVLLAIEHSDENGVLGANRPYGQADGCNFEVADSCGSTTLAGGHIHGTNGVFSYDSDNQLVPFSGLPRFQRAPYRDLENPQERDNLAAIGHYDLIDGGPATVSFYARALYSHIRTTIQYEPEFLEFDGTKYGTPLQTNVDGPRVPADNPYLDAIEPVIGAIPPNGVQVEKRFLEEGPQIDDVSRDTFSVTTGFKGDLPRDFHYDVYYEFGRVSSFENLLNVLSKNRVIAALDVDQNGSPDDPSKWTCADEEYALLGCVPVNLFGYDNAGRAFLNYATVPASIRTTADQTVVSGDVTGNLFSLPAGPVGVAFGADYRDEQATIQPSENILTGDVPKQLAGVSGSYDVGEVFGELNVPILKDKPLVKTLQAGAAIRHSNYSTVGSQTSWSGRLDWAIDPVVRLRGTYGTAVRAPNILELYSPLSSVITTVQDPCDTSQPGGVPAAAQASCQAALGAAAATFTQSQSERQLVGANTQGNADLAPESADTVTAGIVVTPPGLGFLQGLTASLDYYEIRIHNAITTINPQDTVDQCYEQGGLPSLFCGQVHRDPVTGALVAVDQQTINAASESEDGFDLELHTVLELRQALDLPGTLALRVGWAHLFSHSVVPFPGAAVDTLSGQVGDAINRMTLNATYRLGRFAFHSQTRMIGASVADSTLASTVAGNEIPAYWYEDAQIAYLFGDTHTCQVELGVRNLFDRQPPIITVPARTASSGSLTTAGVYDDIGRYVYVSVNVEL